MFGPKIISEERYFYNSSIATLGRMSDKDEVLNESFEPISEQKERETLIKIWGNGTFSHGENGEIGDVSPAVFEFFGLHLGNDSNVVLPRKEEKKPVDKTTDQTSNQGFEAGSTTTEVKSEIKKVKSKEEEKLEEDISAIKRWYENPTETLKLVREPKEYIGSFVLNNINWEHEGLTYSLASKVLGERRNIFIEGQSVSGTGIIKIDRSLETYQLLRALYYYSFNKGWDFENGDEQYIRAKAWLIKHRRELVGVIKNEVLGEQDIDYIAVKAAIVYLLVKGRITTLDVKTIIKELFAFKKTSGECIKKEQKWLDVESRMDDVCDEIFDLINIRFRAFVGSSNDGAYFFVDGERLNAVVKKVLDDGIVSDLKIKGTLPNDALAVNALKLLNVFSEAKDELIDEERQFTKDAKKKLTTWLGEDINESIINKTNMEMIRYLRFIKDDCNLPYEDISLKILYDDLFTSHLLDLINSSNKVTTSSSIDEVFLLLAKLDTEALAKYIEAFEAFGKLLTEKNNYFSSNIDKSLEQKATKIKEVIKTSLDSVSNM